MEPLNDDELKHAISSWRAPTTPHDLRSRIFSARRRWWEWLFIGTIRVPVPVCAVLVVLLVWFAWQPTAPEVTGPSSDGQDEVTLADFQPDTEVQVRVVGALR
jgi:hypothetical protein